MIWLKRLIGTSLFCALFLAALVGPSAFAQTYGQGNYGSCAYGGPCGNTIVTMPNGLEVAINLKNGQVMPRQGYTIVITPLNGSGSSFAKADIYIDSVLRGTTVPGQNGTATWFWDIPKYPGTKVTVVVFDTDSQQLRREFSVSIATEAQEEAAPSTPVPGAAAPSVPVPDTDEPRPGQGGTTGGPASQGFIGKIIVGLQEWVKRLPQYVIDAFPWLLFLLLLIEIILLIWQTRREMRELRILQGLIEREQYIAGLKTGLLQLVSHYLRTPYTILKSGAEGIEGYGIPAEVSQRLQQTIQGLGASIEGLIDQVDGQTAARQASRPTALLKERYAKQRVIIWVPVALIGVVSMLFIWLAYSVDRLEGGLITLLINISLFIIFSIGIWLISRRLYLKRRDTQSAKNILSEATALQGGRDTFIRDAAQMLDGYIRTLQQIAPSLPTAAPMAKFVVTGIEQLSAVQRRFVVATRLQGSSSAAPYGPVPLRKLYDQVAAKLAESAQAKQIKLNLANDIDLVLRSEELVMTVLRSLLDNAIAYSSENSEVSISGQIGAGGVPSISVLDHGSGITQDKLGTLFQPFSKAEGAETFNHEGMGFSLYLDKLIMAYLGGDIAIQSVPGQKTEATVTLSSCLRKRS